VEGRNEGWERRKRMGRKDGKEGRLTASRRNRARPNGLASASISFMGGGENIWADGGTYGQREEHGSSAMYANNETHRDLPFFLPYLLFALYFFPPLNICIYIYISISIYLYIYISIYLYLYIYISIYLYIYISISI
jgi:hypothetical protein